MKSKSFLLLCWLVGVGAYKATANDASSSGVGGSWRMLKGEHRHVQMVREHVRIVPAWGGFQTTADFVFRNYGAATTVEMGFPESQDGVDRDGAESLAYFRSHPTFSRFRSWVDGRRVRVRRHVNRETHRVGALWVKTIRFARNQTRHVRVRYVSSSGGGASDGMMWVAYNFTGGNWRGEVEESVLDIDLWNGTFLLPQWEHEIKGVTHIQRNGNRFRFRWTHWQAQQEFQLSYYSVFPNDLLRHQLEASCSRDSKPYYGVAYDANDNSRPLQLLPRVRGNGRAECVLLGGRLWVSAKAFSPHWDEKRHGVVLKNGGKQAFFSAVGAARRSSLWPLAPNGAFWISEGGHHSILMLPARDVARKLGGRFGLDFARGHAIFVQGTKRTILRANPNV